MKVQFQKYQGAGNDFVLIDNRSGNLSKNDEETIKFLCDRKFGVGADGVVFIQNSDAADFEMVYFNADGKIGSMCGNGARCTVIFAKSLGIVKGNDTYFQAYDGVHKALIINNNLVKVSMTDVKQVKKKNDHFLINTGSPHYVAFVKKLAAYKVYKVGKKMRYSRAFTEDGINVNFVELKKDGIFMRTYERGVENETLACGTGTVAAALAVSVKLKNKESQQAYPIYALGGELKVYFNRVKNTFTNIWLEGPVRKVFEGEIDIIASKVNPHIL